MKSIKPIPVRTTAVALPFSMDVFSEVARDRVRQALSMVAQEELTAFLGADGIELPRELLRSETKGPLAGRDGYEGCFSSDAEAGGLLGELVAQDGEVVVLTQPVGELLESFRLASQAGVAVGIQELELVAQIFDPFAPLMIIRVAGFFLNPSPGAQADAVGGLQRFSERPPAGGASTEFRGTLSGLEQQIRGLLESRRIAGNAGLGCFRFERRQLKRAPGVLNGFSVPSRAQQPRRIAGEPILPLEAGFGQRGFEKAKGYARFFDVAPDFMHSLSRRLVALERARRRGQAPAQGL